MAYQTRSALADKKMVGRAIKDSFIKLDPKIQKENPVMLMVYIAAILTTLLWVVSLFGIKDAPSGFTLAIAIILWFTVLFANFAEAIAEGRGKAQADSLRASKHDVEAHKIPSADKKDSITVVPSASLRKGDIVIVKAGEQIPADGEVIEGAASVDESAITGESAPVIRESGGDRSAVTGGTTVLSDQIVIQVTNDPGESFLDKMIAMVEGAARKKTPNEIALQIFLVALSIIFILVTVSLYTYSAFSAKQAGIDNPTSVTTLVALLVCLAPTTIGALLSAIGIAGMSRLNQANVLAMSGRAIEAAGDVDILMLDKTGTITLGNRQASDFIPVDGATKEELADAAQLSSLADETPEGRSVVVLAKELFGIRERNLTEANAKFIPFTAKTRMSGVDYDGIEIRKGAADTVKEYVLANGGTYSKECEQTVLDISNKGGTPLVVAKDHKILGVIYLKDIIKHGVKEKFADLRKMGIKTIMITGDNPVTAAAIAAEAGVDDFLAEATPEGKLKMIRDYQAKGYLVAMTGDGTNDAPALAQADVAVAMNSGTQAAKEAGNMVDLDSSPTKLIDIVRIMALSGISIYGGADGFESGELTSEICEDNNYICCKKKNVSGTDFEIIRDIALKTPLESCQLVKEYAKLIGNISFQNSYLAAERTDFFEKSLNEFEQKSDDTYYRYVILSDRDESYLNSLSIEQRKKLWILYLTDGLSPIEFDDAFSAMEANEISVFPWELALRLALEETGITVSYENGYFVKNRNGSRILLDFSSDIAAEKLFIKLIFPKRRVLS